MCPVFEDPLLGRLPGLPADFAVDRFAEEVGVAGVACCLLDEVQKYPAEREALAVAKWPYR